jgi:hypothetical protein
MGHQMPPDDDPIIRSIREAGIRPLRPGRVGQSSIGGRHPRLVITGIVLLFVFFLLIPTIAMRLSDWLWYREIGFERVFLTKIVAQWTLGLIIGAIVFAFLYGNARLALQSTDAGIAPPRARRVGAMELPPATRAMLDRGIGLVPVPRLVPRAKSEGRHAEVRAREVLGGTQRGHARERPPGAFPTVRRPIDHAKVPDAFTQQFPFDGKEPSERTQMRVDGVAHHIGFPLFRKIDVRDLSGRMNTGVGSASPIDPNALA